MYRAFVTCVLGVVLLGAAAPGIAGGRTYEELPFTCTVPILDPLGKNDPSRDQPDAPERKPAHALPTNGMSNIDFFRELHRDFDLSATFTLPLAPANTGLFYTNWIILKPLKRSSFVQLELMRWKKYGYREEIGLTWAVSGLHSEPRSRVLGIARPARFRTCA